MDSLPALVCVNQQCCGQGNHVARRLATYGRIEPINVPRIMEGFSLLEKRTANIEREMAKEHSVRLEL